jgi:hypothetical protein
MDKKLKIGLYLMLGAALIIPIGLLLKTLNTTTSLIALVLAFFLELMGLIFVLINILHKRKI